MPTYCFRARNRRRNVVSRVFGVDNCPSSFVENGIRYDRARDAEWGGISVPSAIWNSPIHCVASGVHPSQAGELREFFRKHGENCRVDADGNPVYTSKRQRERCLRLRGMHDKASYF